MDDTFGLESEELRSASDRHSKTKAQSPSLVVCVSLKVVEAIGEEKGAEESHTGPYQNIPNVVFFCMNPTESHESRSAIGGDSVDPSVSQVEKGCALEGSRGMPRWERQMVASVGPFTTDDVFQGCCRPEIQEEGLKEWESTVRIFPYVCGGKGAGWYQDLEHITGRLHPLGLGMENRTRRTRQGQGQEDEPEGKAPDWAHVGGDQLSNPASELITARNHPTSWTTPRRRKEKVL